MGGLGLGWRCWCVCPAVTVPAALWAATRSGYYQTTCELREERKCRWSQARVGRGTSWRLRTQEPQTALLRPHPHPTVPPYLCLRLSFLQKAQSTHPSPKELSIPPNHLCPFHNPTPAVATQATKAPGATRGSPRAREGAGSPPASTPPSVGPSGLRAGGADARTQGELFDLAEAGRSAGSERARHESRAARAPG